MDQIEALLEFVRVLDYHPTTRVSERLRLFNPDSVKPYSEAGLILPGELMPEELEPREDFPFVVKGDIRFPIGKINGSLENGVYLIQQDMKGNAISRNGYGYLGTAAVRTFATMEFGDLYEGHMALPKRVQETPITVGMATVYWSVDHNRKLTSASKTPALSQEHPLSV
ncbi:hypothetical protein HOC80_02415 [archaeon]|jgi:hypothetical protein|nr:hypothetical protein [archaeon]MBT4416933.1 hypothetical protein [archaeon]